MNRTSHVSDTCPMCGGRTYDGDDAVAARCVRCNAVFARRPDGSSTITVTGSDAAEVREVMTHVAKATEGREVSQQEVRKLNNPWFSGLFYLSALIVIVALLAVVGSVVAVWVLPLVIGGSLVLLMLVGALQLRQDDSLSEQGFLALMKDALTRLPEVLRAAKPDSGSGHT